MIKYLSAFAVLAFAAIPSVNAETNAKNIADSGNRYMEICSSTEKAPDKFDEMDFLNSGLCQGFMMGFRDGVGVSIGWFKLDKPSLAYLKDSVEDLGACIPDGVELGQLTRVTLKYIREHPEHAHLPSAALILMAERDAFPCAKPVQK